MAIAFVLNTKSEILKTRKTAAWWLTIAGASLIPLITALTYIFRSDIFVPRLKQDPWQMHIMQCWEATSAFLLPMYVVLVTSLVVQTEYKNNTWKQVYTSPRSYADIYFSKFLLIQFLILGCFLLFNVVVLSGGWVANIIHKDYRFFEAAVPWKMLLRMTGKLYIAILGITAIQYWLSLRFKNYIVPLGIGMALLITGLIIMGWDKVIYYPYSYAALTYFKSNVVGSKHEYYSLIWFAVVTMLGFIDTINRKERG